MYFFNCTRIWPVEMTGINLAGNSVMEDTEILSEFTGALT
jgi:hypothetical protein